MQPIFLDDPAWQTTFPHLVTPLYEEWLAGRVSLSSCDEAEHIGELLPWRLVYQPVFLTELRHNRWLVLVPVRQNQVV